MKTIHVNASKSYDILIERGVLERAGEEIKTVCGAGEALIVSDDTVWDLYGETVLASMQKAGFDVTSFTFPHGEQSKNLSVYADILNALAARHLSRKGLVVALGGGVVGDMAGFAAATYLRGVRFVQIPTTLLSQVDSSVGGKTGVDMPEGKNLVGAFYQPRLVLIDPAVLATLPDQTFADGMAEVVKYGYISNREILDMVSAPDYKKNIERIICECVRIKRDVVTIDEHDTGLRMILNFGHTIGHAAEKLGNYVDLTHGQAVAVGMVAAMRLSAMLGNEDLSERLIGILEHIGLPTELKYGREDIYRSLLSDKKKFGATVNFILVREPGRAEITPIGAEKLHEYVLKL